MEKNFQPDFWGKKLYEDWEKAGLFSPDLSSSKESFTIILPPPNANADLHVGHAMYVYEDIMIRHARLSGKNPLWLPGADHAGFETQFVYEKHLKKLNKSRFDFSREQLYRDIWDFVKKNQGNMESQLKSLGFALDWKKTCFTLDEDIVKIVAETFEKMFTEGLIYRANRLANYCTKDGTAFSDLEIVPFETEGELYFISYPFADKSGKLTVATTRPETLFGDSAVMVHPDDKRYQKYIGQKVCLPISNKEIPIIADSAVDPKFGTGVVKVTPAHDHTDFEVGSRHQLQYNQVIDFSGKMINTGFCDGLKVAMAREQVLTELARLGYLVKTKKHALVKKSCYKCGTTLEPLPLPQWYVKIRPLAEKAISAISTGEVKIFPKRYTKLAIRWLENAIDWNISRQIVWGIRIPAYRCTSKINDKAEGERWFVSTQKSPICKICGKCNPLQDSDTFDTWFSSGQWPFATLLSLEKNFQGISKKFYPTSTMETASDILYFWVCRMIMLGIYKTGSVPFKQVFLHGLVRDGKGQKMSKSKGNVVNPMEYVSRYGADALRASLIFGTSEGNDLSLGEEKVKAMRNFTNKIWNIGRFIWIYENPAVDTQSPKKSDDQASEDPNAILAKLKLELATLTKHYESLFSRNLYAKAFDELYEFTWHRLADHYIEILKSSIMSSDKIVLEELKCQYLLLLRLLHPYMPFVTEAVSRQLGSKLYQ